MTEDKHHWYDGWFYDRLIAPNQDDLFVQIKNLLEPEKDLIDIGCGTGRLAFVLKDKCKSVLGLDLSKSNINRANISLKEKPCENIIFQHKSLDDIVKEGRLHFDYAVLTYVIHEVDELERIDLLKTTAQIADKIIIGDYLVPRPSGFKGLLSESIEYIAGTDHYRNFKTYVANGGIYHLVSETGLKIRHEIKSLPTARHIVILEK